MDLKPVNIRVPVDVLARIDAKAKATNSTRTALLLAMWDAPPLQVLPASPDLPADLQAFVAQRAKDAELSVGQWIERCGDTFALAQQGAAKLTTDELRAIGEVRWSRAMWPGLVSYCFKAGLDQPSATD
jgi:hypothetical protein